MNYQPEWNGKRLWIRCLAGALLLVSSTLSSAAAQTPTSSDGGLILFASAQEGKQEKPPEVAPGPVSSVMPGCNSCGSGCASGKCIPGRFRECCCDDCGFFGRVFCNFYNELCCPDQCYEGKFIPAANAAFFVEGTRPVSTTRIRWDAMLGYTFPDRAEFFWARSGGGGKGPGAIESRVRVHQLSMYTEVAAKGASAFFDIPYLGLDPTVNRDASGFGDMKVGAKTLLFDRDLFQVGFMFTTYLPVGNPGKGLGTGHVSLEPSLLATLKLAPNTFLQGQLSEWIPIAGDPTYAGSILHYHFSLNHVLFRPFSNDVQVIGTAEFNGYSFQDGAFSDPAVGQFQQASADTYVSFGPGLRLVMCDFLDFGIGAAFAVGTHGPNQHYRTEFRIRY